MPRDWLSTASVSPIDALLIIEMYLSTNDFGNSLLAPKSNKEI